MVSILFAENCAGVKKMTNITYANERHELNLDGAGGIQKSSNQEITNEQITNAQITNEQIGKREV